MLLRAEPPSRTTSEPVRSLYTRRIVVGLTPSLRAVSRQDSPLSRSCGMRSARNTAFGRPMGFPDRVPFRRACSTPADTRSRIILRASSAMAAIIVNIALPMGVLVSSASWCETKSIPRARNSSRPKTNCFTLRAKRSNRHTTTTSTHAVRPPSAHPVQAAFPWLHLPDQSNPGIDSIRAG